MSNKEGLRRSLVIEGKIIMQALDKKTKRKHFITAMDALAIPIASFGEGARDLISSFRSTVVISQSLQTMNIIVK